MRDDFYERLAYEISHYFKEKLPQFPCSIFMEEVENGRELFGFKIENLQRPVEPFYKDLNVPALMYDGIESDEEAFHWLEKQYGELLDEICNNYLPFVASRMTQDNSIVRFWTVQKKAVIDRVLAGDTYYPDFSKSKFPETMGESAKMKELYGIVLDAFNRLNRGELPGLIFAFTGQDPSTQRMEQISEDNVVHYFQEHRAAIKSLGKYLDREENVLVQVKFRNDFNPIAIDINDFQAVMPPIMELYPYTNQVLMEIMEDLGAGRYTGSIFPSGLVQVHLPYLKKENIAGVYEMFEL